MEILKHIVILLVNCFFIFMMVEIVFDYIGIILEKLSKFLENRKLYEETPFPVDILWDAIKMAVGVYIVYFLNVLIY